MSKILLLQGNQAVVEGAIAAGVKFFGGYPINPLPKLLNLWLNACLSSAVNSSRWKTRSLPWALLSAQR